MNFWIWEFVLSFQYRINKLSSKTATLRDDCYRSPQFRYICATIEFSNTQTSTLSTVIAILLQFFFLSQASENCVRLGRRLLSFSTVWKQVKKNKNKQQQQQHK